MVAYIKERVSGSVLHTYSNTRSAKQGFSLRKLDRATHFIFDEDWRAREAARNNLIDVTPWNLTPIADHFLHLSQRDDGTESNILVSYTENPDKGAVDVQVPGRRIGRYLKEFYPFLSEDEITRISNAITTKVRGLELKIATTREEIRWVYEHSSGSNGTDSCMSGTCDRFGRDHQDQNLHPVEAYATPEGHIRVAYLTNKPGTGVIARTLIWPEKRHYGRLYGQYEKLQSVLEATGYKPGRFDGALVSKIPFSSRSYRNTSNIDVYLMPYIDFHRIKELPTDHPSHNTHFELVNENTSPAYYGSTNGFIVIERRRCAISMEDLSSEDEVCVYYGRDGNITYVHRRYLTDPTHIWVAPGDSENFYLLGPQTPMVMSGIGSVPRIYADAYMRRSAFDNIWYPVNSMMSINFGTYVTKEQFVEHYRRCTVTGQIDLKDRMTQTARGDWWSREAMKTHGRLLTPSTPFSEPQTLGDILTLALRSHSHSDLEGERR